MKKGQGSFWLFRMRRLKRFKAVLSASVLLLGLAGVGRAEVGFWVGPKGVYFRPSNENIRETFRTFWGWGGEAGWTYKHLEMSAGVSYVHARGKDDMEETQVGRGVVGYFWPHLSMLTVTPHVAYRPWHLRTPYLGFGMGYHRVVWSWKGLSDPVPDVSVSSFSKELYVGYDCRLRRWIGLKAEGAYKAAEAKGPRGSFLSNPIYQSMNGLGFTAGIYSSW